MALRLAREAVITDAEDTETPYDTEGDLTTDGEAHLSALSSSPVHDEEVAAAVVSGCSVETDKLRRTLSQKSRAELEVGAFLRACDECVGANKPRDLSC